MCIIYVGVFLFKYCRVFGYFSFKFNGMKKGGFFIKFSDEKFVDVFLREFYVCLDVFL